MVIDPDFNDIGKGKSKPSTGWRWAGRLLVYPLLGLSGCHMLITGSPIPLWYNEPLDHPVLVKEVTDRTLVLADGRSISLPFVKKLPKNDPAFLKALQHGVEVGQEGELVGLVKIKRTCANGDPFVWIGRRINLSDLAGFIDPDGIDDSIVPPDEIKFLKEDESRSLDRHEVTLYAMAKVRRMRQIYEAARSRVEQEPNPTRSSSREQIDQ
jgi:hypothetical protein